MATKIYQMGNSPELFYLETDDCRLPEAMIIGNAAYEVKADEETVNKLLEKGIRKWFSAQDVLFGDEYVIWGIPNEISFSFTETAKVIINGGLTPEQRELCYGEYAKYAF